METTMDNNIVYKAVNAKPRWATFLLAFCMFSTGASGLVNEYVLATISSYILGNSIKQFSLIIAAMMFMMGLASWFQKKIFDTILIEKFVFVEVLMAIIGASAPLGIYLAYAYLSEVFNIILIGYIMFIGFLIGFEIPLVIRINEDYSKQLKVNLSYVLAMDYIGSFVGAILWVYVLLKYFPLSEIGFIVSGFNFAVAVFACLYFIRHGLVKYVKTIISLLCITSVLLAYGYTNNRIWTISAEQKMYDDEIVFNETTLYQHLVLTYNRYIDDYRLYINGATQFSSVDEAIYHEQLVHPIMKLVGDHSNVLILGGGDGMALREVLKYDDVKSILLVDLDPEMTKLFATNPVLTKLNNNSFKDARVLVQDSGAVNPRIIKTSQEQEDGTTKEVMIPETEDVLMETGEYTKKGKAITKSVAKVNVMNLDADKFLANIPGYFNVIILDFPDPNGVELAKLYSKGFFLKLRKHMAENAMIVMQSTSPYHSKEAFLCIGRTMRAAGIQNIPYHDNVPSFGDWGWWIGWKSGRDLKSVKSQIANITSFDVETRYLTPQVFQSAFAFGKGSLNSKYNQINTMMFPVLMTYYLDEDWKIE